MQSVQAQTLTLESIEEHIEKGTNFNREFYRGNNWLEYALWEDLDVNVIQALLKGGANPSLRKEGREWGSLHIAAQQTSYPAVITTLISAGADPEAVDDLGNSSFLLASAFNKNPEVIKTLAQHSDVNRVDKKGLNGLHLAVIHRQSFEGIMALELIGVDNLVEDSKGRTPLAMAQEIGASRKVINYMEGSYNYRERVNGSCHNSIRKVSQTNGS